MRKTCSTLLLIGILITSLLPVSLVQGDGAKAPEGLPKASLELLRILNITSGYVSSLIDNESQEKVTELYQNASELKKLAEKLYSEGNYTGAMKVAIEAMHLYKAILVSIRVGETPGNEILARALVELHITEHALKYANRTLKRLCHGGGNCILLRENYNETLRAFLKVKEDVEKKNYTALGADLQMMVKARKSLEEAMRVSMKFAVERNTPLLVEAQLRALDKLIARLSALNTSDPEMREHIAELKSERVLLLEALKENNPQKALEILKSLRMEVMRTIRLIGREKRAGEGQWKFPEKPDKRGQNGSRKRGHGGNH
ncbi:hypothetical protein [Thermococcus sp.]|uniref:hypothetical protein n=1 Tax=Thermococcus sp. TaxID=35749 RepID=UPI00262497E3|nr:hypothetical protein [Thermococcus sp.]